MKILQQSAQRGSLTCGRPPLSPRRCPFFPHGALRVGYCSVFLLAARPAAAVRDPFWPIGYEPPKPEPEVVAPEKPVMQEKPPESPKPKPPPVAPITEEDWKKAKALLAVNGFTQSRHPESGETRTLVMINRTSYTVGDTLSLTNANIHFTWTIESLAGLTLGLKPVGANRLSSPPLPAN